MQDANNNQSAVSGQKNSGLRQFAVKMCISFSLAVGLLIAGECVAYYHLPHAEGRGSNYKPYVIWQAHPRLAWQNVDAEGLRLTSHSYCGADEYTIWIFGSSNLWGFLVHDGETIASQLARKYEEAGRRVCVRNYAQPGYASTQELIALMLALKRVQKKPDMVIFYDGVIDSYLPCESEEIDAHQGFNNFKRQFESWRSMDEAGFSYIRNTNTYVALQRFARLRSLVTDAGAPRSIPPERGVELARRTMDNYSKNMEILSVLGAHYGFHHLSFWEPWLPAAEKPLSSEEMLIRARGENDSSGERRAVRATYEMFRKTNQARLFYLGDVFKDHPETMFLGNGDLAPAGNVVVAERIYQILQHPGS